MQAADCTDTLNSVVEFPSMCYKDSTGASLAAFMDTSECFGGTASLIKPSVATASIGLFLGTRGDFQKELQSKLSACIEKEFGCA